MPDDTVVPFLLALAVGILFVGLLVHMWWLAVVAGIGIGAMVGRMAPSGCVDVGQRFDLPALPSREVVLYTAQRDAQAQALIRALSADIPGR